MFNRARAGVTLAFIGAAATALAACDSGKGKATGAAQVSPAQACLQTLDPASGVDTCRTALQASPDDLALRKRLALLRLKGGSLAAARQAYQIVLGKDPNDVEAQFGLALTLETSGESDANLKKLAAVQNDPSVIDTFRKYGFSDLDLMTFDTAPVIVGGESPEKDKAMVPKQPLASGLTVNVKCKAGLDGHPHDCVIISPIPPGEAAFGEAAKKILMTLRIKPAKNKGAPVADAPIVLTYAFYPQT